MSFREWLRPRRHLVALFLAITLVPCVLLVVFAGRMLQQDRTLALDELRQIRDQAADLIVAALEQSLSTAERSLHDRPAPLLEDLAGDADVVKVVFVADAADGFDRADRPDQIEAFPQGRLIFYPTAVPLPQVSARILEPGEALEFRSGDIVKAAAWYRDLARSPDPAVRAAAFVGLARNLKKAQQPDAALSAYAQAADLTTVAVAGVPADLVARWARCDLFATLGRDDELHREAGALYGDLMRGRWHITRPVFDMHVADVERWLGADRPPPAPPAALALAAAVESLWATWRRLPATDERATQLTSSRTSSLFGGVQVTQVSTGNRHQITALVAGPAFVQRQWLGKLTPLLDSQHMRATLHDPAARPSGDSISRRAAADTGLPWTIVVEDVNLPQALARLDDRRGLWLWGLAILAAFVTAGTVVIARAVTRDLALARLQSDFVSAVSHEFRTPLTSLRQLSEILIDERTPTDERRRDYYLALARQTNRLQRLVESLLDFGRMEEDRSPYRLEPLDACAWIRSVVDQFGVEAAGRGYSVELDVSARDGTKTTIAGDQEALTNALWNLLDNAVKYSPGCRTVWVAVERDGSRLAIRVRDQGLGIPRGEQQEIFRKFVRGARAKAEGIRGTGIGLAMVAHIVRGHGGEMRVESEPGTGSTFTMMLPAGAAGRD